MHWVFLADKMVGWNFCFMVLEAERPENGPRMSFTVHGSMMCFHSFGWVISV